VANLHLSLAIGVDSQHPGLLTWPTMLPLSKQIAGSAGDGWQEPRNGK